VISPSSSHVIEKVIFVEARPQWELVQEVAFEKADEEDVVVAYRSPLGRPQVVWRHAWIVHAGAGIGHVVDGAVSLLLDVGAVMGRLVRQGLVQPGGKVGVVGTVKQRHHVRKIGSGELVRRVGDQLELDT